MNLETVIASVNAAPFKTEKVVSVRMQKADNTYFDAKAFMRSTPAMQALALAAIGDELKLEGHWENNPRNGYTTFVVDAVVTDTAPEPDCYKCEFGANADYLCPTCSDSKVSA